jgi:hypothetical protein
MVEEDPIPQSSIMNKYMEMEFVLPHDHTKWPPLCGEEQMQAYVKEG